MKRLDPDWFCKGTIDYELKQYLLLAYLQEVRHQFEQAFLYPALSDLVEKYRHLEQFRDQQNKFIDHLPQELVGVDWQKGKLEYASNFDFSETLKEVTDIVDYSLPRVREHLDRGKMLFEEIEAELEMNPVGILPLDKNCGYFFLHIDGLSEIRAYEFQLSRFHHSAENLWSMRTHFVADFTRSLTNTIENIKLELIRNRKHLPNPATYLFVARKVFPETQSLIPVVKRRLMKEIAA